MASRIADPRSDEGRRKYDDVDLNDIDFEWVAKCTDPRAMRHAVKLLEPEKGCYPQLYDAALRKLVDLDPKRAPFTPPPVSHDDIEAARQDIFAWQDMVAVNDKALTAAKQAGTTPTTTPMGGEAKKSISQSSSTSASSTSSNTTTSSDVIVREAVAVREKLKGNDHFRAGELEDAIACYTRGIDADSGRVELYTNRAAAYIKQKKWGLAESDCMTALAIEPTNHKVRNITIHPQLDDLIRHLSM